VLEKEILFGEYHELEGVYIKKYRKKSSSEFDEEKEITCNICKTTDYIPDDESVYCPKCINPFRRSHILESIY
jgi:hypothetical protein